MVGGKYRYRSFQKHESLSLGDGVFYVYDKTKVKFMRRSQHLEHYRNRCIFSHAQNRTALQPNIFLTGIHRHNRRRLSLAHTTAKVNRRLLLFANDNVTLAWRDSRTKRLEKEAGCIRSLPVWTYRESMEYISPKCIACDNDSKLFLYCMDSECFCRD
jgi:hypothetical protein